MSNRLSGAPGRLSVLLFSGDRDGYLNWLPRYRESKAFKGLDRIVPGQEIRLPSFGGALKVDEQSDGKHDIVLVLGDFRTPSGVRNSSRKRKVGSEAPGGNKQTFYLEIVDGRQRPRLGNSAAP